MAEPIPAYRTDSEWIDAQRILTADYPYMDAVTALMIRQRAIEDMERIETAYERKERPIF